MKVADGDTDHLCEFGINACAFQISLCRGFFPSLQKRMLYGPQFLHRGAQFLMAAKYRNRFYVDKNKVIYIDVRKHQKNFQLNLKSNSKYPCEISGPKYQCFDLPFG